MEINYERLWRDLRDQVRDWSRPEPLTVSARMLGDFMDLQETLATLRLELPKCNLKGLALQDPLEARDSQGGS